MSAAPWSLRTRLSWIVSVMLILVLMPLGIYSFERTLDEITELTDGRLAQAARTLETMVQAGHGVMPRPAQPLLIPSEQPDPRQTGGHKTHEPEVGVQWLAADGRLQMGTRNMLGLPLPPPHGDGFLNIRMPPYHWRIFTLRRADGHGWIRVAERYDSRRTIVRALWFDHSLPLLLGLPLLVLLVHLAVRLGLRPLAQLTQALRQRSPGSHQPMPTMPLPSELRPVLQALNQLLERVDSALERERHFNADVAHELRTPLAATTLHLENAMASRSAQEAKISLNQAHHALGALARRVEQLLALARLESGLAASGRAEVNLTAVAKDVLDEFGPLLLEYGIEVSFQDPGTDILIQGHEAAINALIRNLVENAMRHTPAGGAVQLCLEQVDAAAVIEVIDSGPGIPAHLREAMFQRFERAPGQSIDGLGLGLSLVQRAAQIHGAGIDLLEPAAGPGLRVRVRFPSRPRP